MKSHSRLGMILMMTDQQNTMSNERVKISAKLEYKNSKVEVPFGKNESPDHWLYKIMAVEMLLRDGYKGSGIELEKTLRIGSCNYRADVLAKKSYEMAWVECHGCDLDKLIDLAHDFAGRVLHIDDFWWGSQTGWNRNWIPISGFDSDYQPWSLDLVPEVEHWFCDARSLPVWGVFVDEQGELTFLEEDELGERPERLYAAMWAIHYVRKRELFSHSSDTDWYFPDSLLVSNYGYRPSEEATRIIQSRGGLALDMPHLPILVDLLLSNGFSADLITVRRRQRVGDHLFIPTICCETEGRKFWIEARKDVEKLSYLAEHFDGEIICADNFEWVGSLMSYHDEYLEAPIPKGVTLLALADGELGGWGLRHYRDGSLEFFCAESRYEQLQDVFALIWSQFELINRASKPYRIKKFGFYSA
jgi:hypothetical protein